MLSDSDIDKLRATKSEIEWNAECDRIKEENDGRYPPDWFRRVVVSGLIDAVSRGWK